MAARRKTTIEPATPEPEPGQVAHNRDLLQRISDEQREVALSVSAARVAGETHPGVAVQEGAAAAPTADEAAKGDQATNPAPKGAAKAEAPLATVGDASASPDVGGENTKV